MEEDNKYIKRQKIYKIIMLMILTAFVTSILTAIYIVKLDGNTQTTNNSGVSSILNVLTSDSNLTKSLKGIDMICFNDQGKIIDFEVMLRPKSGLEALAAQMGQRLAAFTPKV